MIQRFALALLVVSSIAPVASADETGGFVVSLGRDTIGVERYRRTPTRLEIEHVGRATRVLEHHVACDFADGVVTRATVRVTAPGSAAPVQTVDATFRHDSVYARVRDGERPPYEVALAVPRQAIVISGTSPWPAYETAIARLLAGGTDSLRTPLYLLGAKGVFWVSLHRLGPDSVDLLNWHKEHYHARVDAGGRVLAAVPVGGPNKFLVSRVAAPDVAAYARTWAARESAGQGLGALSPRDTLEAAVGGASIRVEYGRPGKRGRVIFGGLVPYGEIWRTGANDATVLRTDRPLDFGGTVVPAGSYSLWTIPGPTSWTLVVNAETGQWGTAHDPSKDLFRVPMEVSALAPAVERFTIGVEPAAQGGVLNLDWDATRACARFTVGAPADR